MQAFERAFARVLATLSKTTNHADIYISYKDHIHNNKIGMSFRFRFNIRLHINIAQRTLSKSVEHIVDSNTRRVHTHIKDIRSRGIPTGRRVQDRDGPRDRVRLIEVERLPDPVHIVYHRVVKPEAGIVDR